MYITCRQIGSECERILISNIEIPSTRRYLKLGFFGNQGSIYGDDIATEPNTLISSNYSVSMPKAFVPGLDVLRSFISVYDDLGNQVKRSDLVCKAMVCSSSRPLSECNDLNALVPPQFHLMDDTGAFVIEQYRVPCSLGADSVYLQALLVSYDYLLHSTPFILCLPCGSGQSITVDSTNRNWYCVKCAKNQYVLDPNNILFSCQNCPQGAVCDGNSLSGRVDGSVWVPNYKLGQYFLVSCPPGFEMVTYNGVDSVFAHMNQQCSKCSNNQFILNSSSSNHHCEECPIGASCDGSSLIGLVPGSIWRPDMSLGQYVLISCPPGYEISSSTGVDTYFSYLNQQCLLCKAGWYCLGGIDSGILCRSGTFSLPGANSTSACTNAIFVQLNLLLPMRKSNFIGKLTDFMRCLAVTVQTLEYNILVDEIIPMSSRRGTEADAIEVRCRIATKDQNQGSGVIQKARNPDLSRALLLGGLPQCELLFAAVLSSGNDLSSNQLSDLKLALGLIISALLILGIVFCWSLTRRRIENRDRIALQTKVSEIRSKLFIDKKHGFILQNERTPFLKRKNLVFMNNLYVEAAARIDMKIDFDIRHFDAFCHCFESDIVSLQSEKVLMNYVSSPQYEALCSWLLTICKELIDPNAGINDLGNSYQKHKTSRELYQYFAKICTAQIWKNNQGKLFTELKIIANEFMEQISQKCDARYEQICHETRGSELISLLSWPTQLKLVDSDVRESLPDEEELQGSSQGAAANVPLVGDFQCLGNW